MRLRGRFGIEIKCKTRYFNNGVLTTYEVSQILNISRSFTYQLMQRGEIRTVRMGKAHRVRPEDLRAYIEEHLSPQSQE